jgi:hypothetical protein
LIQTPESDFEDPSGGETYGLSFCRAAFEPEANMLFKRTSLIDEVVDVPQLGDVLRLVPERADARLRHDSIHHALVGFMEQPKPYVGLIIDLRGSNYAVSSADLATLMFAMMDHEEGALIRTSVLLEESPAKLFQSMLDITQLGFAELQVVGSMDRAIEHLTEVDA